MLDGLLSHGMAYGLGDADPNSALGNIAQQETSAFVADLKDRLVANFGADKAGEMFLKIQIAAQGLTKRAIRGHLSDIAVQLRGEARRPHRAIDAGSIRSRFPSAVEEDRIRQCLAGNPAACR